MHRAWVAAFLQSMGLALAAAAFATASGPVRAQANAAVPAPPEPGEPATLWLCGLSEDLLRLICVADIDPARVETAPAAAPRGAVVNGTRFPLDTQRRWVVDLWSPPSDLARLAQLAQASICYRTPGCRAELAVPQALRLALAGR